MSRGLRAAGAASVALYVLAAVLTGRLPGGGRPLFDGFAPPAPYRWVSPPPELVSTNERPEQAERNVPLTAEGNEATNASTSDAQVIVTLPTGAIPPNGDDTTVRLRLLPLDPATLAPLPDGLRPASNVYRVTLDYQPSGETVTAIAPGPAVALTGAVQATQLLYSPDGSAWGQAQARPFGNTHGYTGPFLGPGFYIVVAPPPTPVAGPKGGPGPWAWTALAAALAAVGTAAAAVLRRRRRAGQLRQAEAAARTKAASRRPGPSRGKKKGKGGRR